MSNDLPCVIKLVRRFVVGVTLLLCREVVAQFVAPFHLEPPCLSES